MCCDIELLRLHHQNTKTVVSHFIKQSQKLFNDKECSYYNIPAIVGAITSLYVVHCEYFTSHGVFLKPTNRFHVCTVKGYGSYTKHTIGYNTVYGNIKINKMNKISLYRWTFNVKREYFHRGGFGIGIDSSPQQFVGCVYYDKRYNPNPFYSLQFASSTTSKFSQKDTNIKFAQCKYKESTIVTMELNVKTRTVQYYFDGIDQGIAFDDVDFEHNRKYFMALVLDNNTVIQLIDFHQE